MKGNPRSREGRIALAKMVTRLFDLWKVSAKDQAVLLGLPETSGRNLARYRNGSPFPDSRDLLDRAANLLSIHQSLRILFPNNRDISYKWPTTPNRVFGGMSPVEFVRVGGFIGLFIVKRHLDFEHER
jgi:hypothetical protein